MVINRRTQQSRNASSRRLHLLFLEAKKRSIAAFLSESSKSFQNVRGSIIVENQISDKKVVELNK